MGKSQRHFYMDDDKYMKVKQHLERDFDVALDTPSLVVNKVFDVFIEKEGLNGS